MCNIAYGQCECGEHYNGESAQKTVTRWSEHSNLDHISELTKHIVRNVDHELTWEIYPQRQRTKL